MLGDRYVVERSDSLGKIAAKTLGGGKQWPRISRYTNKAGTRHSWRLIGSPGTDTRGSVPRPSLDARVVQSLVWLAVALLYPRFRASTQLLAAAKSQPPPIGRGAHGGGVLMIQGALLDLGFKLPRSTRKTGKPDGIFGQESAQAMSDYQKSRKLKNVDGVVGRETMEALDKDMLALAHPASLSPPVPVPAPVDAEYTLGAADPPVSRDPGAGAWNSKPTEATYVGLKTAILNALPASVIVIGDDAAAHMLHYLLNSGRGYDIDLDGMVKDVPSAKQRYEREVAQAQSFVEKLTPGSYDITSLHAENGYNRKSENSNWFYAIGGYST